MVSAAPANVMRRSAKPRRSVSATRVAPSIDVSGRLGKGWVAMFAIEVVLYVVGAAFIVLVLSKDRAVRAYKAAAATDPLTSLLNRRGFFEAAAAMMGAHQASKTPVSVLAFDIDHFKKINDNHGHAAGDAMLQLFASVVSRTIRGGDIIGRVGGEEFVALLSGPMAETAVAAERMRNAFVAATNGPNGHGIPATVSVGIACGSPHASIDVLIARADAALYRAKANGRNRVELSDEAVPAPGRAAAAPPLPTLQPQLAQAISGHAVPIVRRHGG